MLGKNAFWEKYGETAVGKLHLGKLVQKNS